MTKKTKKSFKLVQPEKKLVEPKPKAERKKPLFTFDMWWSLIQKKHNLKASMKDAIYKHFKARGFLNSKNFDDGLRDFGIKS